MKDVHTLVERRCAMPDDWKEHLKDDVDVERREASRTRPANNGYDGTEEDQVLLIKGATLPMEPVDWHWKGHLAYGKLHLLAGNKGAGKSTICFDWMAATSIGGTWPDGSVAPIGDVLVWSGEDDAKDTILPRFAAAGGDRDRIYIVGGTITNGVKRSFDPSTDIPALIRSVSELPNLKMTVIDPVVMTLPVKSDSHNNAETRRGLQPLVDLAEERRIVLIGVTHFTKGTAGKDPIERVTGSLAFGALPRVILGASADEDDLQRRLVRIASNIGPSGGGFEYTLFQAPLPEHNFSAQRVQWGVQLKGSAQELLEGAKRSAEGEAAAFLSQFLSDGPKKQREVKDAADAHCHSWPTIRRAQKKLGIKPTQEGRHWHWALPGNSSTWTRVSDV
jgi:putative DNA primase/helicase